MNFHIIIQLAQQPEGEGVHCRACRRHTEVERVVLEQEANGLDGLARGERSALELDESAPRRRGALRKENDLVPLHILGPVRYGPGDVLTRVRVQPVNEDWLQGAREGPEEGYVGVLNK